MAVVPLAIPITVGPATTGVLLVMGADMNTPSGKAVALSALLCAALTVGILLWMAGRIERRIGKTGLSILSKLTGLMLASLAAQMIMTGVRNFMS
jgi:multiple antibiotic resistance protein